MEESIFIRQISASDNSEWRRLWTACLAFYETVVEEEVYKLSFGRLLSDDDRELQCFLAEVDGKPFGFAHFIYHRFIWSVQDTCYLMDLCADPELRGRGTGRKMIEAVHLKANRHG